jgi:5-methylcytosine-specific restriction endonuclease McrA
VPVLFGKESIVSLKISEQILLDKRLAEVFDREKDRARRAGRYLAYRLDDLKGLAGKVLERSLCPYCRAPLTVVNLIFDHKVAPERGGKFTLKNLDLLCGDCHSVKGPLDNQELRELLALIAGWPRPVACHFKERLKAGAQRVACTLPREGSLEWFTGVLPSRESVPAETAGSPAA